LSDLFANNSTSHLTAYYGDGKAIESFLGVGVQVFPNIRVILELVGEICLADAVHFSLFIAYNRHSINLVTIDQIF
jgi:hypothetical protein